MIEISDLSFKYKSEPDDKIIFEDISLSFSENSFNIIKGESGSGKTTFLNLISGFIEPSKGSVKIDGQDIFSLNDKGKSKLRNSSIGYIFQDFNLLPHYNVIENIMMPFYFSGSQDKGSAENRMYDFLDKLNIEKLALSYPSSLAGGEAQRAAIARALLMEPSIILADEPTGSLDRNNEENIFNLIVEIKKEKSITVILVTHKDIKIDGARYYEIIDKKLVQRSVNKGHIIL